ncbi:LLM class flavin-dependent oxidoreductase [Mesobacillus foraminis]|uniref:Luciferase family oxidoreductase group 1 n=1 Tax=Mesobacillus foraminis TaxID=279826 RepID=A0A4R2BM32_9BACI|nr:LLM class flavin-dependent oxidoreductase [Mesobacillus foraminis]TCN28126.1 luciferase family oxidoreductase group 1 [Mesobacillus foraminis]
MVKNELDNDLPLSILDFVHVYAGSNPIQSLKNSTEMVQLADRLGYKRYWFTEHHNTPSQVSTSPDLLSLHAASHSQNIRVGSGGIMLPNHSPLKVVENFTLLEALYPGRVDLGIGRASGTDGLTALALQRSQESVTSNDFPEQLDQLLSFFSRNFPAHHPFKKIIVPGNGLLVPDLYMLGSSQGGVQFAIDKGLGFVFAAHLEPRLAIPMLRSYRENFKPSIYMNEPKSMLAIGVITAETEEEAKYLAGPVELMWARMATGSRDLSFPTTEEASKYVYTPQEKEARQYNKDRFVIGSAANVAEKLKRMANEALVDEIMIADFYPDQASRLKGYQLLAEEFDFSSK